MPSRFDEFWCWVPRKVAKKATRIEYAKAVRDGATEDEIIAGGQRWWHASIGKDPKYIVHPRRWVKEGRWEDEPDQVVKPSEDAVLQSRAWKVRQGMLVPAPDERERMEKAGYL